MKGNMREGNNGSVVDTGFDKSGPIESIWAFLIEDKEGNNGLVAMGEVDDSGKITAQPFVTGDAKTLNQLKTIVVNEVLPEAKKDGLTVKCYKFSNRVQENLLSDSTTEPPTKNEEKTEIPEDEVHPKATQIVEAFMASLPSSEDKDSLRITRDVLEVMARVSISTLLNDKDSSGLQSILEYSFRKASMEYTMAGLRHLEDMIGGLGDQKEAPTTQQ